MEISQKASQIGLSFKTVIILFTTTVRIDDFYGLHTGLLFNTYDIAIFRIRDQYTSWGGRGVGFFS